ncbi:MAG: NUDIX domain-containing protein [Anaerolineales bacterium]|nr:NUDIX domain-containing protein [Anaerolineales bacterium]
MPRAPFQVLVFPYRKVGDAEFEYAILRRADEGYWHVVAGGGQDDEVPLEAARRETQEETGLPDDSTFTPLDTVMSIPVTEFGDGHIWGDDVYVIPCYCFGVLVEDKEITLSREHSEYRWVKFEEAHRVIRYEGNKVAFWELDRRLRGLGPVD